MAEKTLNTRIKLRYASFDEWQSSSVVLLTGEVAICYIGANNAEVKNTAPTVLFKVGDGTHVFKDLQWASARAADVYDWAKAENLIIEKEGTGNVVASISWDTANKKFTYTTTSVATTEDLSQLQTTVSNLTNALNNIQERLATAEGSIANNAAAIEIINGDASTEGSIAKAVAKETTDRTNADNALSERITTNTNNLSDEIARAKAAEEANKALIEANASAITTLTEGIDPDKIDGVKDLINYVETHGPEVTVIRDDISTLQGYFEDGAAKNAKNADTLGGKTYQDIISAVGTVQFIVATSAEDTPKDITWLDGTTSITGTLEADNAESNSIYLVPSANGVNNNYNEYIVVDKTTKTWEKIGSTDIDLSGYAKDGVYETSAATDENSGLGGATTITSAENSEQTANGTATITYDKATQTSSAGSNDTLADTDSATPTIAATFEGTEAILEHSIEDNGHTHLLGQTIVYSSPESTNKGGVHTHKINSHSHNEDVEVVIGAELQGGSKAQLTNTTTSVISSVSGSEGTIASVDSNGILTLSAKALTAINKGATNVVNSITFTPNVIPTVYLTKQKVPGTTVMAELKTTEGGEHIHNIARIERTVANGVIEDSTTGIVVQSHQFTPSGNITATQEGHSHKYVELPVHTHDITTEEAQASGAVSITVPIHTHDVNVPEHTHSIAHTHTVEISSSKNNK